MKNTPTPKVHPTQEQLETLFAVLDLADTQARADTRADEESAEDEEFRLFLFGVLTKVSYQLKVRFGAGDLNDRQIAVLESIPGWDWHPRPDEIDFMTQIAAAAAAEAVAA